MKILIATGIYPPDIGGPATYAKEIHDVWAAEGHTVKVVTYGKERILPTGLRHFVYFLKVLARGWDAQAVLVLDTWSAALPTMYACRMLRKGYVIRTGGDFLWESYVNRTKKRVLFREFYDKSISDLNTKEKLVLRLTRKVLRNASAIIFSTEWQRDIFKDAYSLEGGKLFIVENCYRHAEKPSLPRNRSFVASARGAVFKNADLLKSAFEDARKEVKDLDLPDISLDTGLYPHDEFQDVVKNSYAVILVSLGDISPNMIMEALRHGVPCIVTQENGILNRIKDHVLLVDPLNKEDIKEKIVWLSDSSNREEAARRARAFSFTHGWEEVASKIMGIMQASR